MQTTQRESTAVAAAVALALAGCAGLSLTAGHAIRSGDRGPSAESVAGLSWIVGWMLLAWAAIVGGAVATQLVRAVASRHRPRVVEVVLLVATAAAVAGVVYAHPPFGSGEAVGQRVTHIGR